MSAGTVGGSPASRSGSRGGASGLWLCLGPPKPWGPGLPLDSSPAGPAAMDVSGLIAVGAKTGCCAVNFRHLSVLGDTVEMGRRTRLRFDPKQ